jgi:hypothetical protein
MIDWQLIPKDGRRILARSVSEGYISVVVWNGHEWECVDKNGRGRGVGFYPKQWANLE